MPGGFGDRGTEGKILAAKYARENKVPYLGLCLGFQLAGTYIIIIYNVSFVVVEFARNVMGVVNATSEEFMRSSCAPSVPSSVSEITKMGPAANSLLPRPNSRLTLSPVTPAVVPPLPSGSGSGEPVVIFMPEIDKSNMGGTMRLGARTTVFNNPNSIMCKAYGGAMQVSERHRHRYEVNPKYSKDIDANGLKFVGRDEKGERMQVCELEGHPFYVGTQAHPEFKYVMHENEK